MCLNSLLCWQHVFISLSVCSHLFSCINDHQYIPYINLWENDDIVPTLLTSALHGDEWSVSRSCRFTPGEAVPGTHCIGSWVRPQSRSGRCGQEKTLDHAGNGTPPIQSVAILTELSWLYNIQGRNSKQNTTGSRPFSTQNLMIHKETFDTRNKYDFACCTGLLNFLH
jgi:hypothetical protein